MTPEVRTAFAELRSLCQSTHNPKTWQAILDALKSWPDEATLVELAVPYATDHLNHWPDHFRNCDEHALDLLVDGEAPLYMSVLTRLGNINIFADSDPGIPRFEDRKNWTWLSTNEALTSIRSLNVRNHMLDDETLTQVAQSPHLSNIKNIDIGGNDFSPEGCAQFAREMTQKHIEQLFFWGNRFDDEALHTLGQNPTY